MRLALCFSTLLALGIISTAGWSQQPPVQAGSTALAEGAVTATGPDGSTRTLHDGDAIYAGDTITTGSNSYADLELDDEGRLLLRPGTQFQIQKFDFDPAEHGLVSGADSDAGTVQANTTAGTAEPTTENALFRLIKGGLRVIDGLIGQSEPQDYALQTPVATIGVRGTQYDVRYCDNDCQDSGQANGLYTAVSQGSISVRNDSGENIVKSGHYGFLSGRRAAFKRLRTLPRALLHMSLPQKFRARAERMRRLIRKRRLQRWKALAKKHRRARRIRRRHERRGESG